MDLPLVTVMTYATPADTYLRVRHWLQWILVAFCFLVLIVRLETPCNLEHRNLNSIQQAKADFHGQEPRQQQYWKWPQDPDTCAAKVRDINSWLSAGPTQAPFEIPQIIHQTVEDKHNISCEVLECMQTWKDMNPGYEHRLYDARDRDQFIRKHYPELHSVYQALSTNVERADLWRYLALHKYGGVYADSDVRCITPVHEWNAVNNHDADLLVGIVYTDTQGMVTRVNNFIIAAMPCHPVMAAMPFTAMSRIAAAGLQGKSVGGEKGQALTEAVIARTGPAALTATIGDYAKRLGAAWPVNGTAGAEGAGLGNLVSTVRLMPRNILTMGWETAAERITCDEAFQRNPGAYICHQYFGTWKASYNHRTALTYSHKCKYWGLNETAEAEAAMQQDPVGEQLAAAFSMGFKSSTEQPQQQSGELGSDSAGQLQPQQQQQHQWQLAWSSDSSSQPIDEEQRVHDQTDDGDDGSAGGDDVEHH